MMPPAHSQSQAQAQTTNPTLTPQDRRQLKARGVTLRTLERQLAAYRRGVTFTRLAKPCVIDDGIRRLPPSTLPALLQHFARAMTAGRVTLFVPASGMATRMFQDVQACCLAADDDRGAASDQHALQQFLAGLPHFAFYDDLKHTLSRRRRPLDRLLAEGRHRLILDALLRSPGLNFSAVPKGMLPFHAYADGTRTPLAEHLVAAAAYAKDGDGRARLHVTTSPAHRDAIRRHLAHSRRTLSRYAETWDVRCSMQHPSTDVIAVDADHQPFRDARGHVLFRPSGHGALLANLHDLRGDIVFLKTIDNVAHDHHTADAHRYKQSLGGMLVEMQDTLFAWLTRLASHTASAALLRQATDWARQSLAVTMPDTWDTFTTPQQSRWLFARLNRPLRVCGMVANAGDHGGGPFWVTQRDGTTTLQIVDHAEIDPDDTAQQHVFASSTHFNPVDIVCGVRDYTGAAFDLHQFADTGDGMMTTKLHDGRALQSIERPGLWNGAMAHWHSVFVEVPRHTFTPVKTVQDLLLPAHQPSTREPQTSS